jgi:hypothetical protein
MDREAVLTRFVQPVPGAKVAVARVSRSSAKVVIASSFDPVVGTLVETEAAAAESIELLPMTSRGDDGDSPLHSVISPLARLEPEVKVALVTPPGLLG